MPGNSDIILFVEYDCESGAIILSDVTPPDPNNSYFIPYSLYGVFNVLVNGIMSSFYVGNAIANNLPFSSVFSSPNQTNVVLGYIPGLTSGSLEVFIHSPSLPGRIKTSFSININCNGLDCIRKKICLSDCCKPCKKCNKEFLFLMLGYIAHKGAMLCDMYNESYKMMNIISDFCKLNKKCC